MNQFLRELKDFMPKSNIELTDTVERHVVEAASQLEENHNMTQKVYGKFNDLFHDLFRYDFIAATRTDLDSYPEDVHRFTWLFYLLIKGKDATPWSEWLGGFRNEKSLSRGQLYYRRILAERKMVSVYRLALRDVLH